MPFADNNGVRIHYEQEGNGEPLVLLHGFAMSIEFWRDLGYVSALQNDFRLIMIDLRGHGSSDKPHDSAAYNPNDVTNDVITVLDDLRCDRAHFFGHSGGAAVGYRLGAAAPDRFSSLVLVSFGPYMSPKQNELYARMRAVANVSLARLIAGIESTAAVTAKQRTMLLANDVQALAAWAEGGCRWPPVDSLLPEITSPALVMSGDDDPNYDGALESVNHMPRARFVPLAGLGHIDAFLQRDLVLPHVRGFLSEVSCVARADL